MPDSLSVYHVPESELNHCFNVDSIQQQCTKVWLRVNVHFFLDDDCEGTLDPLGVENIPIEDAYETAEDIIKRANEALDNNYKQWVQIPLWGFAPEDEKPEQCVPIRYALSGVYVWCNTTAKNTTGGAPYWFQSNFGQYTDTEYNAFFVEWIGDATGQANGQPGNAFTAENFGASVFNHEMGHVLDLGHSFNDDMVDDTPQVGFRYDYNCDGDKIDNFSLGIGWEGEWRQCWDNLSRDFYNGNRYLDYDGDGAIDYPDLCDMAAPCLFYPCCSWDYVDNNIMAYSRYNECCAAYTEGQITRILENLSTDTYCKYIEEITSDCPPPMANIHILPTEADKDDCSYCLNLSASMHDEYYKVDFFKSNGDPLYTTGWLSGPANRFCISKSIRPPYNYNYGFQAGQSYTAKLTVENYCGDKTEEEITFLFEGVGCDPEYPEQQVAITNLYPNPFTNALQVDYETQKAGHLNLWLAPASGPDILMHSEYITTPGSYQKSLSTSSIASGVYYFILELDGELIAETILKI